MKLDFFIEKLVEIQKEYGEDLELVYAIDDEGNAFHHVLFHPTVGILDGDIFTKDLDNPTVICVN